MLCRFFIHLNKQQRRQISGLWDLKRYVVSGSRTLSMTGKEIGVAIGQVVA